MQTETQGEMRERDYIRATVSLSLQLFFTLLTCTRHYETVVELWAQIKTTRHRYKK